MSSPETGYQTSDASHTQINPGWTRVSRFWLGREDSSRNELVALVSLTPFVNPIKFILKDLFHMMLP